MPDEKKWITVAEAAEKSGYTVRTIQRLLQDGKVDGWKPGRDWLTTLESVMAYKENVKMGRPRKDDEQNTWQKLSSWRKLSLTREIAHSLASLDNLQVAAFSVRFRL